MEIKYQDIILRDMRESDIEDEIRWNTLDTAWALWDAPWEMEEELANFDPAACREQMLRRLHSHQEGFRWHFEVDTLDGCHIGSVNAYCIDEHYDWVRSTEGREGETFYNTLGLDISDSRYWGRGLGTQALTAFIQYQLDNGYRNICLQTWSGNERMIHVAEKLGFAECNREVGFRHVRGGTYDGLTFRLDVEAFQNRPVEIRYRDILLRDKRESDIDDCIRWYNEETEWIYWDAPDETFEPVDPVAYRSEELEWLAQPMSGFRTYLELSTAAGIHIGHVCCYAINDQYQWIPWDKTADPVRWTIGIHICDSRYWSKGLGTQAVAAYVRYHLENENSPIYLQTWSGNIRMIRCAQRLGFAECQRIVGDKLVAGTSYDSLTFRLDEAAFEAYWKNNL